MDRIPVMVPGITCRRHGDQWILEANLPHDYYIFRSNFLLVVSPLSLMFRLNLLTCAIANSQKNLILVSWSYEFVLSVDYS